ncbi:MAG: ATP-dependent helicase, partial [Desulfovibrio sp.]|nr:ATP-dependent helicase [Desulfovibrio sp.]
NKRIEIWNGDRLLEIRDLPVKEYLGKSYVQYKGRLVQIQADCEVWLTGRPPCKKAPAMPVPPPQRPSSRRHLLAFGASVASRAPIEKADPAMSGADSPLSPWDAAQWEIISAPANARILVNACPGSGKTAVACGRVAYLMENANCNPDGIWLLSFTRVAVAEICNRLGRYLKNPGRIHEPHISTLDSLAWQLNWGFDAGASLSLGYDRNMARAFELASQSRELQDWLGSLTHIIIDEAQDVVGPRASLVCAALVHLAPECGVTILSDDAQAIYGFTDDQAGKGAAGGEFAGRTLPEIIRAKKLPFAARSLQTVHRTGAGELLHIYTRVRAAILDEIGESADSWRKIREQIRAGATTQDECGFDPLQLGPCQLPENGREVFALFRTKKETFLACASLPGQMAFRIQTGGIARELPCWLGALAPVSKPPYLFHEDFERTASASASLFPENAWEILGGKNGSGRVRLADLGRISSHSLDARLLKKELGMAGPLFGTIHAVKGREADLVHLYLGEDAHSRHFREECRVLFVGASRARKNLYAHVSRKDGTAGERFLMGLNGEITALTLAGKKLYASKQEAEAAQQALRQLAIGFMASPVPVPAKAVLKDSRYELQDLAGNRLCFLDEALNRELEKRPGGAPAIIEGIKIMDIVTCKAEEGERLHEPWNSFRFLLKPRIFGYLAI